MFLELETCHFRFMVPRCVHFVFLKKVQQKWILDFGLFFEKSMWGGIMKWQNSCQNFRYLIPLNEMYARTTDKNRRKIFLSLEAKP